jgi:predicted secreted protein
LEALSADELVLRVGEKHVIVLEGFGSAGYVWEPVVEGDVGAVDVFIGPAHAQPTADDAEPPMAFSVDQEGAITGRNPGNATVRFRLARPWEAEVREERSVRVEVIAGQADP